MRVLTRALLLSAIAVCLPMFELAAVAAEVVKVPEGSGTWVMTISPGRSSAESTGPARNAAPVTTADAVNEERSPIQLASYQRTVGSADAPARFTPLETALGVPPAIGPVRHVDPDAYFDVYRSIPFVRSEYEANPSYRHEATMEILFGQMRPSVTHRTTVAREPRLAAVGVPPYIVDPYLGQIPTFRWRYPAPAIPFGGW